MANLHTYRELTEAKLFGYCTANTPLDLIAIYINAAQENPAHVVLYHAPLPQVVTQIATAHDFSCTVRFSVPGNQMVGTRDDLVMNMSGAALRASCDIPPQFILYTLKDLTENAAAAPENQARETGRQVDFNNSWAALKYLCAADPAEEIVLLAGAHEISQFINSAGRDLLPPTAPKAAILAEVNQLVRRAQIPGITQVKKSVTAAGRGD